MVAAAAVETAPRTHSVHADLCVCGAPFGVMHDCAVMPSCADPDMMPYEPMEEVEQ